jgi:hypothetical protein
MTDESNNSAVAETDNVETTELDTEESFDYYDPDDDQDTVEPEPDATDEGDETADEAEVGDDEAAVETPAQITLKDGTQVTLDELQNGYFRQADYSRKTQELATFRTTLEADAKRIEGITQAFVDHLTSMLPAAPDAALAMRNPTLHYQQAQAHAAAMDQVKKLIELGETPKQVTASMAETDKQRAIADGNARLNEMFPTTRTPKGKVKFFTEAASAANELGFSNDELNGVLDPRMFALAHWAKIGLNAAKARAKVQAKVAAAPPAAPRKPGQAAMGANGNAKAFEKLNRSGSIHDAVKIDWA